MWVFYLISLPITLGLVAITLWYFAGPHVPRYVRFTVGYTWFCSVSIIILVPADIWATLIDSDRTGISFLWSVSYWSTFLLTWVVVPIIQGYEDAGDFTVTERLKTSVHVNLVYYVCVGVIGLFGVILLILLRKDWSGNILGFAMACSNTFGLVTGAFLLGFSLSEIPRGIWRNADWTNRQKVLSHKVAKMAVNFDDAHQEFSNDIVVAQATSKQMSKRDPLRPYMTVIDKMLAQMLIEDPSFKPQGGRIQSDMDYDTDEKTMASLRRQLETAREKYYRYKSEYMSYVTEALELEDTIKNYQHRSSNRWKYVSSFRHERSGRLGSFLDTFELIWRCILRKQVEKVLAIVLGCMSAAILVAEATILPSGVDLSLFSILINAVKKHEMLVQVTVLIPLTYMCVCTYYSLFKIGMFFFYSLTPGQTSSVSLLQICSMVARYAPPISYNFLNLIHLNDGAKTMFEKRMGNIDDAVPFFGKGFNKIYPLIMVIYTVIIASNFFDRVFRYFGNWKIFKVQTEVADNLDGFDPSGLIILQRERAWHEQGHNVGELVIPLARAFNSTSLDVESGNNLASGESKASTNNMEDGNNSVSKPLKQEAQNESTRESITKKYAAMRTQRDLSLKEKSTSSLDNTETPTNIGVGIEEASSSKIALTWDAMKTSLLHLKSNIESNNFIPLRQGSGQDSRHSRISSVESLDDIFERIKRPSSDRSSFGDR